MTISDIKASIVTIATTLSVNVAYLIDLIPDNIGKVSAVFGIVALIYVIRHHKQTVVKNEQQIEINKLEIAERVIRINNLREEKHD